MLLATAALAAPLPARAGDDAVKEKQELRVAAAELRDFLKQKDAFTHSQQPTPF